MNHRDIEALIKGIAPVLRDFVAEAVKGFDDRLAALEKRTPERGEPGAAGRDGIDGKDGASVTISDIEPLLLEHVAKAVAAVPAPKDGVDGKDGAAGRDGIDGKDAPAVTRDDILAAIKSDPSLIGEVVDAHLKDNPPPAGRDGKDAPAVSPEMLAAALLPAEEGVLSPLKQVVADYIKAFPPAAGRDGQPGVPGAPGRDGKDGLDGKDGAAGLDGLGFDDIEVRHDGERALTIAFVRGEAKKEFTVDVPAIIDRGVWRDGPHKAGDGVTWDGSWFVAQKDTDKRPGTPDSGWRLAAKRGRDGASAFDVAKKAGFKGGEPEWIESLRGKQGEPGKPGRDLTQMTYSGEKY
jgi:hypothetical protein